jgi:hypothetical protein
LNSSDVMISQVEYITFNELELIGPSGQNSLKITNMPKKKLITNTFVTHAP